MIKLIFCYRRKPGMPVEDFQAYWSDTHRRLAARIPGLRHYEQNHVKPSAYARTVAPIFDGVEKFWVDSVEALQAMRAGAAFGAASADLDIFTDTAATKSIVAQEAVIKDGPRSDGMLRLIEFLTRRPGMETAAFHDHWEKIHGPLVAKQPQIRRYVQSHTLMEEYAEPTWPDYDGVTEAWFDGTDAMREAVAAPLWAEVLQDEENFVPKNTPFILSIDRTVTL
ncbi:MULTISPECIES: EthD family reductase [unclassified Chelatococcus]|uniref:EthD domain-containing protein n=1 Tax=unclassified Chelatococcus TaxID=2638111 RepID=UPI001BCD523B|nr:MULTISPECIES: EthD family reductase [unclassified Chelatococcus]MBS7701383.1 EthD family reductase [Chelatococcus sp. YT9]MBX3557463.1 EthD family reductase [Chelatococcus sp.]